MVAFWYSNGCVTCQLSFEAFCMIVHLVRSAKSPRLVRNTTVSYNLNDLSCTTRCGFQTSLPLSDGILFTCIQIIQTVEMRSFRRLLGISYKDHITNEEVRSRIRKAIGPYKELLSTVKRRKMKWYGHITRASGLAKTVLQGTIRGGRRRGRQRKLWEDNIRDWMGLGLSDAVRRAEEREEWRMLVARSCGAPTVPKTMG